MTVSRGLDDAGVSAREAEVLAAVGEHLTNAEIAERLYISVRTVESHVSSLLRKLGVEDRRALARLAEDEAVPAPSYPPAGDRGARGDAGGRSEPGPPASAWTLPAPLTPFVGRVAERAALADAVAASRLVTALGPGGVGKTRLALAVAAEVVDLFPGGVWYVDLVPVTDPGMVTPTVAATLGLGEQPGRSLEDTVASAVGARRTLLVLDNCEHLADGVAVLVERLLTRCPELSVLATSRIRLVLPFERPFPVPGLSLPDAAPARGSAAAGDGGPGDAVALFLARAAALGTPLDTPEDRRRVAEVCRALDGMALAIELAASRLPALGLDGLEAGLADRLRILTGGSRADERHRSLRATLDWSYALAAPADRATLRRVAVFAAPFTAPAAAAVAGDAPAGPGGEPGVRADEVPNALARLVDQSLLEVVRAPDETRYRALEIVRQYAGDAADAAGESEAIRDRHLDWCLAAAGDVAPPDHGPLDDDWHAAFDRRADDLRAALRWAAAQADRGRRAKAHRLALALAGLAYRRGRTGESQHRYEEAAALADDDGAAAAALHRAALVAGNRMAGDDAMRLHQESATAALRHGDPVAGARDLALAATLVSRAPGIMAHPHTIAEGQQLLARAKVLATGRPELDPVLMVADAFLGDESEYVAAELAARAVELARRQRDPLTECAALDVLMSTQLAVGELHPAYAAARRRVELLEALPMTPEASFERSDGIQMAAESALSVGDLPHARRYAQRLTRITSNRETPYLGLSRLLMVNALAGEWDAVVADGERWLASWDAAGRPVASNLASAPRATSLVHALRGDEAQYARWQAVASELRAAIDRVPGAQDVVAPFVAGLVAIHRGDFGGAVTALEARPDCFRSWFTGQWRHWYGAAWAEAAVLAGTDDARERIGRARLLTDRNPVVDALVDRAQALATGDREGLLASAAPLAQAGARYQWARTMALAGGDEGAKGRAALDDLGAAPMAPAPGFPA